MLVAVLGFASEAAAVIWDFVPTNADYNGDGIINSADYVLWRKSPNNFNGTPVGYNLWAQNFGKLSPGSSGNYNVAANWINHADNSTGVPTEVDFALVRSGGTLNFTAADGDISAYLIRVGAGPQTNPDAVFSDVDPPAPPTYGGTGTLNWTGGNIVGNTTNSVGARLNVGETINNIEYAGKVNQTGGVISLSTLTSFLNIGANGVTTTPTSAYNLMPGGTIVVNSGGGNNNGINVRNGTLNMTGGSIISDNPTNNNRAMTVGSGTQGSLGNEIVAYANFSGDSIVDVYGGLRVASQSHTKGYVTISGNANLHFRIDFQVAAPGTSGTNGYGQVDMSGGTLTLGDLLGGITRRLIIGDSGTGVFNLSGGTVDLHNSLVVGNNSVSKGTLYQTGGTLTVISVELNRNDGIWDLNTENATVIIDGPSAVFIQRNSPDTALTGQTTIGKVGKGRFEVRQGQANLREIRPSETLQSRATIAVTGGILRVQDALNRTNVDPASIPNIILTGGELEFTPPLPATAFQWQASLNLQGTDFDPRPGGVLQTNLGNPTRPGNFALNTGSVWDLDIASNTLFGGADWVDVNNGTAALNGGVLNIHHVGGYTPAAGHKVTILRDLLGSLTLNSGAVTVSNPNWGLQMNATDKTIELLYVGTGSGSSLNGGSPIPEPSTIVLVGLFASVSLGSRRVRCGKGYGHRAWSARKPKGRQFGDDPKSGFELTIR